MTEEEAHLTQCCGPEGCGRFNDNPYPARWCVGASCMAWRWKTVPNPAWKPGNGVSLGWPQTNPYSETPAGIPSATDGGCGLAGTPQ